MRVFTAVPSARFTGVVYLHDGTLLVGTCNRGNHSATWLYDLTGLAEPRRVGIDQWFAASQLYYPGADAYLRRHGGWPDGADLPLPQTAAWSWLHPLPAAPHLCGVAAFDPAGDGVLATEAVVTGGFYSTRFHLRGTDDPTPLFHAPTSFGPCGAFSTDGRLVAMSGGDPAVSVWDVADRREVIRCDQTDKVKALAFLDPDRLAVAAGRTVRVWDVGRRSVAKLGTFRKHAEGLAASPDGRLLAVGSRDGTVRVWEAATGRLISTYDWGIGAVNAVAFAPGGATAAAAGAGGLVVWDLD